MVGKGKNRPRPKAPAKIDSVVKMRLSRPEICPQAWMVFTRLWTEKAPEVLGNKRKTRQTVAVWRVLDLVEQGCPRMNTPPKLRFRFQMPFLYHPVGYCHELSARVGVANVNLSKMKNGHISAIRFSTLAAICDVLKCQPGDILEYSPEEKNN